MSMASTMVTICLDENDKRQFEQVVNSLGMNMTTAYTVLTKQVIKNQGFPFGITVDPMDNPEIRARIIEDLKETVSYADSSEATYFSNDEVAARLGIRV